LSGIHAARVVASGNCIDAATEKALAGPVAQLNQRLISQSIDVAIFWPALIREVARNKDGSGGKVSDQASCEQALIAAGISEFQSEQTSRAVAHLLGQCREAFATRYPKLRDQLQLRAGPLRQSWETVGPGMLRSISKRIWSGDPPDDWWPARVEGHLVQPMRGGDGNIAGEKRFWIEAMLTDADPALPEVLRIAFLVTRMAIEAHVRQRSGDVLSSLPWTEAACVVVLDTAAEFGLVSAADPPLDAAVARWLRGDTWSAEVLRSWADQWHQTKAAMPVALKALARMTEVRRGEIADQNLPAGLDLLDEDTLRELGIQDDP